MVLFLFLANLVVPLPQTPWWAYVAFCWTLVTVSFARSRLQQMSPSLILNHSLYGLIYEGLAIVRLPRCHLYSSLFLYILRANQTCCNAFYGLLEWRFNQFRLFICECWLEFVYKLPCWSKRNILQWFYTRILYLVIANLPPLILRIIYATFDNLLRNHRWLFVPWTQYSNGDCDLTWRRH